MIKTATLELSTKGNTDVIDITEKVQKEISNSKFKNGSVTAFVVGSTAGITVVEYEPGLVEDLKEVFEKIAPRDKYYHHHETWHDDNGHSHVRASLLKPGLTIPFIDGKLTLGTWQQIILIDFDTKARERKVIVQIIGE